MEPRRVRLHLRVAPRATSSAVVGRHGAGWKIRVAAPPERGRANDEVVSVLANVLGLPRPDIRVVAGATGRDKVVELDGMPLGEIERRLAAQGKETT